MKELIQQLVETTGPSGYESKVRDLVIENISRYTKDVKVDALGNVIAHMGNKKPGGLSIMLSAHMDEIGVIVTHVDDNGFLRFTTIGGVRAVNCIGGRVQFLNGLHGVIFVEKLENANQVPTFDQLYIDCGFSTRKECPLQVGDLAIFERPFIDMGKRIVSKALDDRIGVAIQIDVMRQLKQTPHDVFFVFSTQEEVGTRGATTSAYGINPDLGISIDVTVTGDTPKSARMSVSLGKGPAIKVRDSGMLADPRLVQHFIQIAESKKIPYQLEVLEGGTTDARAIQTSRAGVPSGSISIPCRYVHSPSEMVDMDDVENAVRLILSFLSDPINL
ncbi:M42 family metallopeptidase [Leptolinea tardivitalis]|uniref:Aminopeptidase n=1 Tax=Leptolinea tardivitalis TaxID=229920 RepID=A0A0P6X9K1_9CHLR|nr:M42 family metallopeptidase [Leptolinea tardivitalis]KPL71132.1 aminopeptidase [Leptolinea tardivitalis]GAP22565.1 cellulase M [Leptolinea tardivitalis]